MTNDNEKPIDRPQLNIAVLDLDAHNEIELKKSRDTISGSQGAIVVDDDESVRLSGDCPKCCKLPSKILACICVCYLLLLCL